MKEVVRKCIDPRSIVFDNSLKGSNVSFFLYNFWFFKKGVELESNFVEPSMIIEKYKISFGVKDGNNIESDTMKVWAPWNPQSGYQERIGIGFFDISSINSGKCDTPVKAERPLNKISRLGEFVYSKNKADYLIHLAPGRYRIIGSSGNARCVGASETGYFVFINGSSQNEFIVRNESEWIVDFIVAEKDPVARITFVPLDGFIWSIANIEVHSLDRVHDDLRDNLKYLVSYKLLPREKIVDSNNLYLYTLSPFGIKNKKFSLNN
jgi:hypothetical protein